MSDPSMHGPAWDIATEYAGPASPAVEDDLEELSRLLDAMQSANEALLLNDPVRAAQTLFNLSQNAATLLANLSTFARCALSVDSKDEAAQVLLGRLKNVSKRFAELGEPVTQFLQRASAEEIDRYLDHPETQAAAFSVSHLRKQAHEMLSLPEETLVSALSQDGIHAWGALYGQLSGTLRCQVLSGNQRQEMGVAEAAALLSSRELPVRQSAWRAINEAWEAHEETCAASLNAIAGWRLEMARKRSKGKTVHYLDAPLHRSRIDHATLESFLAVAEESKELARRAAKLQARAYGQRQLGPWDVRAPAPRLRDYTVAETVPFKEALALIANAFASIDPQMGRFVEMMGERRWIEGTVGPNKRPGAYCTEFAKSRTPRVYMTYDGSASEIVTLAHELGHAYHNWVMRDLPPCQTSYGMSLAETASTFAETLVRDTLYANAPSAAAKLDILWEDLAALVAFVLNIPTRFSFEQRFYDRRAERPLRPREFKQLMGEAWEAWYGDVLCEPDPMFWASKLHFFISGLSFYNFPYLFGYLFSAGIYARRAAYADAFLPWFNALLRDTGRMTAEDIGRKHLEVDLHDAAFWRESISSVAPKVDAFSDLLDDLGL